MQDLFSFGLDLNNLKVCTMLLFGLRLKEAFSLKTCHRHVFLTLKARDHKHQGLCNMQGLFSCLDPQVVPNSKKYQTFMIPTHACVTAVAAVAGM